jgi:flagellar protein FlaG
MSVQMGHLSLVTAAEPSSGAASPARPAPAAAPTHSAAATADVIGAAPPPELADEVGAAADRAQQMADANRELHFAKDPHSGRIIVQVRDLDGNVVRTIPPSQALDIMSGLSEP